MEWPRIEHGEPAEKDLVACDRRILELARLVANPHLCDVPDCPGPRLVAKLEAAERHAESVRHRIKELLGITSHEMAFLAAWDSAGEGR